MLKQKKGKNVIIGKNVHLGQNVIIWNYVVIGEGTKVDDGTSIGSFCDIGKNVVIGEKCNIQAHVTISNECEIGNNVFIGPKACLLNDKYPKCSLLRPPRIKDNVVVGGGAIILPDVVIGENSVIAAGSIVTKAVSSGTVVKGIPAKNFMTRDEYEAKRKIFLKSDR
jgi:acetyltransferase-like isoleucine patch superfamily enzyme